MKTSSADHWGDIYADAYISNDRWLTSLPVIMPTDNPFYITPMVDEGPRQWPVFFAWGFYGWKNRS